MPADTDRSPLVTIIVPSFNQGRFIRETIDSCLGQDYRPVEVLVFDGGSTDETVAVLKSFNAPELEWWSQPDNGVVDAVNRGLARARGEILTIQSSDDVFLPGAITAGVAALRAAPQAGIAFGDIELIDEHSTVIGRDIQGEFDLCAYLGRMQYIPQPGTCFTRHALEVAGAWRDSVSYAADADFWMRIASRVPVAKIARPVARYRYHDQQRDAQRACIARDWITAVRDLVATGALTPRQRRFARMGNQLARYRYAPPGAWWERTWALYAALAANPSGIFDARFPRRDLLPGRDPVFRSLSHIKRAMGIPPRKSR
jgi:glycosyltransferase involved in cell wall biosynthesis